MLATFRHYANAWVVKLLFGLLALSFVGWGVGDIFRTHVNTAAITVGGQEIQAAQVQTEFRHEVERLRPMFGGQIDTDTIRQLGLVDRLVDQIVARTVLDLAARDLGIKVADGTLRETIAGEKAFRNSHGDFDKGLYERVLAGAGLTEADYVASLRRDITRAEITSGIEAGAAAPQVLAAALYRFTRESRTADTLLVPFAAMTGIDPPGPSDLAAYHKAHAAQFMSPAFRSLTAVLLKPEDAAAGIAIGDKELRDAYDNRKAEFSAQPKRKLLQIVVADKAKAERIEGLIKRGDDFLAVARKEAGLQPAAADLGWQSAADLLPELQKAAFATPKGTVTEPIQSPLGWHILKVEDAAGGSVPSLEEVKPRLIETLRKERASDALYALANKLDDALGGGGGLEEAAQSLGLKTIKFPAMDAKGQDLDGKPVPGLPADPGFLKTAFATPQRQQSSVAEMASGGFYVLTVDKVTPPAEKPLEAVKAEVAAAWTADKRAELARAQADALVAKLNAGETPTASSLSALAHGRPVKTTKPFTRDQQGAEIPAPLIPALFKLPVGKAVTAPAENGILVAVLSGVVPADPAADPQGVAALREKLAGAVGNDLVAEYTEALKKRYGVTLDHGLLDRLTAGS